jgi:5'-nucleotidase
MTPARALKTIFFAILLPAIVSTLLFSSGLLRQDLGGFTLRIAHFNDSHASIEETELPLRINGRDVTVGAGGYARLAAKALEMRRDSGNFLLLCAGDVFQGSPYFTKYLGQADLELLNIARLDAMVPGNHEFDRGSPALAGFISGASFPVISSNIDYSRDPLLRGKTRQYKIFSFHGVKVGLLGLATEDSARISNPPKELLFLDAMESARRTVERLKLMGVKVIIVLSHLGLQRDMELARSVDDIDIIVGGHSHSLLGDFAPAGLKTDGEYPLVKKSPGGGKTLIVQAWEKSKIIGDISLAFDAEGRIRDYRAAPVLMLGNSLSIRDARGKARPADKKTSDLIMKDIALSKNMALVEPDRKALERIAVLAEPIRILRDTTAGYALHHLKHSRLPEGRESGGDLGGAMSLLAPLVTESMAWKIRTACLAEHPIAVINAGGLRADIPAGPISMERVCGMMPFGNTLVLLELSGRDLRETLEHVFTEALAGRNTGGFPCVKNLRFVGTGGKNPALNAVEVNEGQGWEPLDDGRLYTIVTSSYLAGGSDGYDNFSDCGRAATRALWTPRSSWITWK